MEKMKQLVKAMEVEEQQQLMVHLIEGSTPEAQLALLLPSVTAAASYVKWRLVTNLQGQDTPDLLLLLPPELQLAVLSYVDGISLLNASQVSRTWNSIIKTHSELWMKQCRRLGVNMAQVCVGVDWQKTYVTSVRQQVALKNGTSFTERFMQLQNCKKAVKAVDYKDGFLCTVSEEDYINIWQLDMNIPLLTFPVGRAVSCIKFHPGSLLLCGHFVGTLASWDLSGMSQAPCTVWEHLDNRQPENLKNKFKMHAGPVFSCDFSEELDLLVSGGADECLKFWSLSSGVQVKSLSNQHYILKVILIPDLSFTSNHEIVYMTRESVQKIFWPSIVKQDCDEVREKGDKDSILSARHYGMIEEITHCFEISLYEDDTNYFTPGLQYTCSSKYIGIAKPDVEEKHTHLCVYDIETFRLEHNIPLSIKVKKLLALGNRYALLLTKGTVLYSSTLVIIDIITQKTIGTRSIPHSKMTTPDGAQLVVGDVKWLDGLGPHLPGPAHSLSDVQSERSECGASAEIEQKLACQGCRTEVSECCRNTVAQDNDKSVDLQPYSVLCSKRKSKSNTRGNEPLVGGEAVVEMSVDGSCCEPEESQNTSHALVECGSVSDQCECLVMDRSQETYTCHQPQQPSFLVLAAGILNEPGRLFTLWWAQSRHPRKCKKE